MKAILTTLAALAILAAPASAEVLWDQSDYNEFGAGFFNSVSGSPPFGSTVYGVNDVTVDGSGWHVDQITVWFSFIDGGWGSAISQGHLHVFPKIGPLPIDVVDDPTTSVVVPMTGVPGTGTWVVSASGLNLDLAPGEYWIGITPLAPSGPFGPEIHIGTFTTIGDATASYDPFGLFGPPSTWFNMTPGVDGSMLIEGTRPTAVENATWAQIKSVYR